MRKPPMTPEEIGQRRAEIVASRGPWRSDNLRLAKDVFTIGDGAAGREAHVRSAVQLVADVAGSPLADLRVLDLSCAEGGLALEMGKQGAEVVALETRPALAEKAEFAREALGLQRVKIVRADPRTVSPEEIGYFDVVFAVGILDRHDASGVVEIARCAGAVCKGFALIESCPAARPRGSREHDGIVLRGAPRTTNGQPTFVLTRASTLALLVRCGFSSIVEALSPDAEPGVSRFVAFKGRRVSLQTIPHANAVVPPAWADGGPARKRTLVRLLGRGRR